MIDRPSESRSIAARVLDWVERVGNRLPDPTTLFVIGAVLVMLLSHWGEVGGWSVEKTVTTRLETAGGTVVEKRQVDVVAESLLTRDGLFWAVRTMVTNFTGFAPLGIVLVGMLGIGVAEKTGLIGALLKSFMRVTPSSLLTPSLVFVGIMSSMALDAGYIVLPPIACVLFKAVGRSPLVGLAAVFSGIGAGFSANLFITGLDPLLSGFTTIGAQVTDASYDVKPTCNWWFMIVSTFLLTLVGWGVTHWMVEPRYSRRPPEEGGPGGAIMDEDHSGLTALERRGLVLAVATAVAVVAAVIVLTQVPGSFLYGTGERFSRWVEVIVPILFFAFLVPGIVYGVAARTVRNDKDVAKLMAGTMADMAPYIVMAFFAAQFVAYFNYSHLGEMLAIVGGEALAASGLPTWMLLSAFIVLVACANLFIGSASAKYAFLAPVFVPMFMHVGISPELTQAAYRVGDSCTNTIAPLNPYIIVLLVFMQKYVPKAGIGTLVSLMLPYSLTFLVIWTVLLVAWQQTGIELGPAGPLVYEGP